MIICLRDRFSEFSRGSACATGLLSAAIKFVVQLLNIFIASWMYPFPLIYRFPLSLTYTELHLLATAERAVRPFAAARAVAAS